MDATLFLVGAGLGLALLVARRYYAVVYGCAYTCAACDATGPEGRGLSASAATADAWRKAQFRGWAPAGAGVVCERCSTCGGRT